MWVTDWTFNLVLRWFNFEKVVQALVAEERHYLNRKQLQAIVQEVCFIESENEVDIMLDFYHDLRLIVKHGTTVVLQAQWLINVFKQLITIPCYQDMVKPTFNISLTLNISVSTGLPAITMFLNLTWYNINGWYCWPKPESSCVLFASASFCLQN